MPISSGTLIRRPTRTLANKEITADEAFDRNYRINRISEIRPIGNQTSSHPAILLILFILSKCPDVSFLSLAFPLDLAEFDSRKWHRRTEPEYSRRGAAQRRRDLFVWAPPAILPLFAAPLRDESSSFAISPTNDGSLLLRLGTDRGLQTSSGLAIAPSGADRGLQTSSGLPVAPSGRRPRTADLLREVGCGTSDFRWRRGARSKARWCRLVLVTQLGSDTDIRHRMRLEKFLDCCLAL
jgi:hypothetical protein